MAARYCGVGENHIGLGYNRGMVIENPSRRSRKSPPPGDTGQEAAYLRFLSDKQVPVTVKLRDGESVSGWIEYFDDRMIRLTREGRPNLFIYKQQIRTITEQGRRAPKNDAARNASEEPREIRRD
jgi:host factor-I protein